MAHSTLLLSDMGLVHVLSVQLAHQQLLCLWFHLCTVWCTLPPSSSPEQNRLLVFFSHVKCLKYLTSAFCLCMSLRGGLEPGDKRKSHKDCTLVLTLLFMTCVALQKCLTLSNWFLYLQNMDKHHTCTSLISSILPKGDDTGTAGSKKKTVNNMQLAGWLSRWCEIRWDHAWKPCSTVQGLESRCNKFYIWSFLLRKDNK